MSDLDMNLMVVFIPVSDIDHYADYDDRVGYGSMDQVFISDDNSILHRTGIIVSKDREEEMRKHVEKFESSRRK